MIIVALFLKVAIYFCSIFSNSGTNACSESNGGCDELCLALPNSERVCACSDGKKVSNETHCIGKMSSDNTYNQHWLLLSTKFKTVLKKCATVFNSRHSCLKKVAPIKKDIQFAEGYKMLHWQITAESFCGWSCEFVTCEKLYWFIIDNPKCENITILSVLFLLRQSKCKEWQIIMANITSQLS